MFTGIVREVGTVENIESKNKILDIYISAGRLIDELEAGSSIAVDGCCLTVTEVQDDDCFGAQVTQETLSKTNFTKLKIGSKVNLEPSLKLGDNLDGHLVQGHVDGCGEVLEILKDNNNKIVKILFPKELKDFIASKGSISVNGVSLTVIEVKNDTFSFTLIPYTKGNTNLGLLKTGDIVNLEVDLISRYLVNYLKNNYAVRA